MLGIVNQLDRVGRVYGASPEGVGAAPVAHWGLTLMCRAGGGSPSAHGSLMPAFHSSTWTGGGSVARVGDEGGRKHSGQLGAQVHWHDGSMRAADVACGAAAGHPHCAQNPNCTPSACASASYPNVCSPSRSCRSCHSRRSSGAGCGQWGSRSAGGGRRRRHRHHKRAGPQPQTSGGGQSRPAHGAEVQRSTGILRTRGDMAVRLAVARQC